jgi:hypothetical protein
LDTDLDILLDQLIKLESTCSQQLAHGDYEAVVHTLQQAAAVDNRLRHRLGVLGRTTQRSADVRRFRSRNLLVLRLVDELEIDGWELVSPEDPSRRGFADRQLAKGN